MPTSSKSDGYQEENSLYAQLWEYRVTVMALDHFFAEVIEGNVPLTNGDPWWDRGIVVERVNQYSKPWCLLFEAVSTMRERIESQVMHSLVEIDQNLKMSYHRRGKADGDEITWVADENGRF